MSRQKNSPILYIMIFIIGFFAVYGLYSRHEENTDTTSLQKYYQTHPDQYNKDMNNRQFMDNVKSEIKSQEEKSNLYK